MRQLTSTGHITFARTKIHPNGTPYLLFAQVEINPRRVVLVKRKPDGGFDLVWEFKQNTPPFTSHPGDGDFAFLPEGGVYIAMPFSVKAMGDKTALFEEVLPNASPPFADNAHYTVNIVEDHIARNDAKAAIQHGQRAELLGKQALDRAREDGATNERTLREVGEELKGSMEDIAWSKAADRIYHEIKQAGAPLPSTIRDVVLAVLAEKGI